MSAFLGKIHHWLYNKILLHEGLIESVVGLANEKGYNCESLLNESYGKYGRPVTGALEDNIEHSNIHGWLQERIYSVEKRLAYTITELLRNEVVTIEEISPLFHQNGASIMKTLGIAEREPQVLFTHIIDHMLEGMPCDRVNEIVEKDETVMIWKTTRCLHKDHWDEVGGDVGNFYFLRENWINGFLDAGGTGFSYTRAAEGINIIRKV